jgi:hypothetical protein
MQHEQQMTCGTTRQQDYLWWIDTGYYMGCDRGFSVCKQPTLSNRETTEIEGCGGEGNHELRNGLNGAIT